MSTNDETSMKNLNDYLTRHGYTSVRVATHETARNKAIANGDLSAASTIVDTPALAAALLSEEKGQRCDACFRRSTNDTKLRKCSGCAEYWYCDENCQRQHWKALHRHMCKTINSSLSSTAFQGLPSHERMDALLLSHFLAAHHKSLKATPPSKDEESELLSVFLDLLPFNSPSPTPPVINMDFPSIQQDVVDGAYSRFSNNNFVIHSHLDKVGHGIFPLASRLFNHSCSPNAIMVFTFGGDGQPPSMLVRALRGIKAGEEITVPYFDPALPYQRRQEICRFSYGFTCTCTLCEFSKSIDPVSEPPKDDEEQVAAFERALFQFAFPDSIIKWPAAPLLAALSQHLHPIFHENYMPALSKTFRDAAHDGPWDLALTKGLALLAAYMIIYPPYFPQTGVHLLELAKIAWNTTIKEGIPDEVAANTLRRSREFLNLASPSLAALVEEGDEGSGPAEEFIALRSLLRPSNESPNIDQL